MHHLELWLLVAAPATAVAMWTEGLLVKVVLRDVVLEGNAEAWRAAHLGPGCVAAGGRHVRAVARYGRQFGHAILIVCWIGIGTSLTEHALHLQSTIEKPDVGAGGVVTDAAARIVALLGAEQAANLRVVNKLELLARVAVVRSRAVPHGDELRTCNSEATEGRYEGGPVQISRKGCQAFSLIMEKHGTVCGVAT